VIAKGQHLLLGRQLIVRGLDHVPAVGGVIVACNHVSFADPVTLGLAMERRGRAVRYLAKRELFDNPILRPLLQMTNQIPVDRGGAAATSLRAAEGALIEGAVVGVFPEATIPRPGQPPRCAKTGAVRLALRTGAPLVPAATWGGQAVSWSEGRSRGNWLRAGARLAVCFGPAMSVSALDDPTEATERLMARIGELAEEARRVVA
jgi:1-acyl-sn-glycerol-3-phosphate acyltransferase